MSEYLAPFPYFGGKAQVADLIWSRFGDTPNYVEPFMGSGAVLLARPKTQWRAGRIETANELDPYIVNLYRAMAAEPDAVARYADHPVFESDLHARHYWLVARKADLRAHIEGDPDYYDAKIAGWWVWGASAWIGSDWCSGKGGWTVVNGQLATCDVNSDAKISRRRPHLSGSGQGMHKKTRISLDDWFNWLSERLRRVRLTCGDWSRVVTPAVSKRLDRDFPRSALRSQGSRCRCLRS